MTARVDGLPACLWLTHPSTNRAQCRATILIETTALLVPLSEIVIILCAHTAPMISHFRLIHSFSHNSGKVLIFCNAAIKH